MVGHQYCLWCPFLVYSLLLTYHALFVHCLSVGVAILQEAGLCFLMSELFPWYDQTTGGGIFRKHQKGGGRPHPQDEWSRGILALQILRYSFLSSKESPVVTSLNLVRLAVRGRSESHAEYIGLEAVDTEVPRHYKFLGTNFKQKIFQVTA